ncbi:hypothetical protein XYCOK13_24050 [Xylanibacillus composti]|uniref:ThuA-like domain-containing protein n=1 Tax=Xylanibacillus composti TaxID=1572762 RepID=A0A8J4H4R2_9BACL|nr:ThuA domain-containing protein [Xylanibacillus composti]GIQ69581.1 hypothetical protein XYCOK13_24050 [Xylanibacillus composti]
MAALRALVLGDNAKADWHPFDKIREGVTTILSEVVEITYTEDYDALLADSLNSYDVFVSLADQWKNKLTSEQTAGLLSFVSNGGAFVCIHNGISLQSRSEVCRMIGAKFTGHPPYREIQIEVAATDHPIMKDVPSFIIQDEPYQYDLLPYTDKTVLMEYEHEGGRVPAGWCQEYGLGRVVYLMPGHDAGPFDIPAYRTVIRQSVQWAAKLL